MHEEPPNHLDPNTRELLAQSLLLVCGIPLLLMYFVWSMLLNLIVDPVMSLWDGIRWRIIRWTRT